MWDQVWDWHVIDIADRRQLLVFEAVVRYLHAAPHRRSPERYQGISQRKPLISLTLSAGFTRPGNAWVWQPSRPGHPPRRSQPPLCQPPKAITAPPARFERLEGYLSH